MATTPPVTNEKTQAESLSSGETAHEHTHHANGHMTHFASQPQVIEPTTNKEKAGESASESSDAKIELTEEDCYDELGFSFPSWKKWTILTVIFWVQVSMNFNTSLYSNALTNPIDGGITEEFGVSAQAARVGAAIFLITYAFGCELWAPWSEGKLRILPLQCCFRRMLTFDQNSADGPSSSSHWASSTFGTCQLLWHPTSDPWLSVVPWAA